MTVAAATLTATAPYAVLCSVCAGQTAQGRWVYTVTTAVMALSPVVLAAAAIAWLAWLHRNPGPRRPNTGPPRARAKMTQGIGLRSIRKGCGVTEAEHGPAGYGPREGRETPRPWPLNTGSTRNSRALPTQRLDIGIKRRVLGWAVTITAGALAANVGCGDPVAERFTAPQIFAGVTVDARTLNRGHHAYSVYCAACHGSAGDGRGWAAANLKVPPRDFRVAKFKFTGTPQGRLPRDQDLARIITGGLAGTAMRPWPLPDQVVGDLLQYLKTFSPPERGFRHPRKKIAEPVTDKDPWEAESPAAAVARGGEVYHGLAACYGCHPRLRRPQRHQPRPRRLFHASNRRAARRLAAPASAPEHNLHPPCARCPKLHHRRRLLGGPTVPPRAMREKTAVGSAGLHRPPPAHRAHRCTTFTESSPPAFPGPPCRHGATPSTTAIYGQWRTSSEASRKPRPLAPITPTHTEFVKQVD